MNLPFVSAILGYLLRGRLSWPKGHLPPAGHVVPEGFAGVGVAASENPAMDDWIVEALLAANIRHVRIDFTYGDQTGPAGRLLERLLDKGFKVVLHLLQPLAAAQQMPEAAAEETWRKFLVATLERYGARVEMLEICSTVNRKRWAGYTLDGFFSAWQIAWQEVRARGLLLAGPSITDFEPPWNIGLLSALQKRGQLPDIQTNNLFSERCTEPERYDHKIFGRSLAAFVRVNLIKKARLLQRIGSDFGVPRLFSPAAFWTLPRIERMLPQGEEKQADYLTRYMVLCAASGALEAAWWGPLICHREGLVDDAVEPYPALERITHYLSVTGELADLRCRPAFHALRTFNALIPGAQYEGRLNAGQGLEVHAFRSATQLIHVVWTINAGAAPLADLYSDADSRDASCLSRDGVQLTDRPTLATEEPLYLCWSSERQVQIKPDASVIKGLRIHRHVPGKNHYFFRENGWRGIILAASADEASLLWREMSPDKLAAPSKETILRHARNAIWMIPDPRNPACQLVVKQPVKMHFHKRLLDRFKPSKGMRSWSGSSELLRRGIGAAPPVAWLEKVQDPSLRNNLYICEYVQADFSARELLSSYARGNSVFHGVEEQAAYRQLAQFLRLMHGRGIFFRDLSGGNILVRCSEKAELSFSLIDTGRIHAFPAPLAASKRMADLVRICNKLHWAGREKVMALYLAAGKSTMNWRHRLQFRLYDFKVAAKRRVGRKFFKRLFSGK